MATASGCEILAGRTSDGYCVKVRGTGTMVQSTVVQEFVTHSLANGADSIVLDLNECTYLDSTFLGCILNLHRKYNAPATKQFSVSASAEKVQQLLAASRLDKLLPVTAGPSPCIGECVVLPVTGSAEKTAFARHIMECHQHLAEIEGPNQAKFAMIAQHMAQELAAAAKI